MPPKRKKDIIKMVIKSRTTGKVPRLLHDVEKLQHAVIAEEKAFKKIPDHADLTRLRSQVEPEHGHDINGDIEISYGKYSYFRGDWLKKSREAGRKEHIVKHQVSSVLQGMTEDEQEDWVDEDRGQQTGHVWEDWIEKDIGYRQVEDDPL